MLEKILGSNRNVLITLAVITALCYSTLHKNDYVSFDDGVLVRRHFLVAPEKVPAARYFQYNFKNPHYKPLVYLTWRAERKLFGDNPVPVHMNNLLLHILNTLLMFFIGLRLLKMMDLPDNRIRIFAFLMALFFALHPMKVESVAWATTRKDVLYSFFFLLGWLSYLKHLETKNYLFLALALVSYFLGMLAKSMGITLVAVLVLTNYFHTRKISPLKYASVIPFVLVFVFSLYMYGLFDNFKEHAAGITNTTIIDNLPADFERNIEQPKDIFAGYPTAVQRVVFISFRLVLWITHVLIPVVLSVMYPREQLIDFFGQSILFFPIIIAALLFWAWKTRNKNLLILFGILFFFITISPAVAINEKGSGVFLPDRYTYMPSLGVFFVLLGVFANAKIKPKTLGILAVVYFSFLGIKSFNQVKVWRNSESLWNNTVKHFPDFARGLNSRGYYYMSVGENEKALRDFTRAIKNDPSYLGPYNNRCELLFRMGRYPEALADVDILLKHRPNYVKFNTTKAGILFKLGRTQEAVEFSQRAIALRPNNLPANKNLAIIYLQTGKYAESVKHWEVVIQQEPRNALNYVDMASALIRVNKLEEALSACTNAIEINPEIANAWHNRSYIYNRLGNREKALEDALQAQKLGANISESYINRLK